MNKNNGNIPVSGGVKEIPRSKSLTPAVLGVANSHGVKLSINMTSEDKKELLSQLEEWRKARREKLAASILAKQKQIEKPKVSMVPIPIKTKPVSMGDFKNSKIPSRASVFERLYNNNGKIKKPETAICSTKPLLNSKKSTPLPFGNPNKPVKNLLAEKEKIGKFQTEISEQNLPPDSMTSNMEITKQSDENDFPNISEEQCNEAGITTQPLSYPINNKVKIDEEKPVKAIKCTTSKITTKLLPIEAEKKKNPLRRSISMMFRKKRCTEFAVRRSISAKSLHEIGFNKNTIEISSFKTLKQPAEDSSKGIKNEVHSKSVSFVTPKSNKSLTSTHLRAKLEDWLKVNGHPLEGYRHLRCFDITNNKKPLLEAPSTPLSNDLEIACPATTPKTPVDESDKENVTPPTVIRQVDIMDVENWLKELHRLIVELKYPSERCEEWLTAIRKKCASCTQLPIYWECLAAIHEMKGDLKSAIEDYERAIIKGGEVDVVGDSLAQLFDRMVIEQKKSPKRKLEKGLDPKNIFKSTIIKFALQQKALKKLSSEIEPGVRQQLYIATPVRRSTRIQTPFKSKAEVTSLQTLTPEVLKNVTFQPNESLLRRD